jgi:hypothetical protein
MRETKQLSSCYLSQAFEDRHFTEREISFETSDAVTDENLYRPFRTGELGSSKGHSHPAKKYIRPVFMSGHLSGDRIPDVLIAWNEPDRLKEGPPLVRIVGKSHPSAVAFVSRAARFADESEPLYP